MIIRGGECCTPPCCPHGSLSNCTPSQSATLCLCALASSPLASCVDWPAVFLDTGGAIVEVREEVTYGAGTEARGERGERGEEGGVGTGTAILCCWLGLLTGTIRGTEGITRVGAIIRGLSVEICLVMLPLGLCLDFTVVGTWSI